jgi:ABC-type uncharacterized transport system substrate-binding protein
MRFSTIYSLPLAGLIALATGAVTSAQAHPHVWVTSKAEVVYENGKLAAIQHHWSFDEFYTTMAIQGLDTNNDNIYSREELAELSKVNMDGLAEFGYFTSAKLGNSKLAFAAPVDHWLEHKDGILTLHFKLPVKEPIAADAKGFQFAVYDSSFFIAFELAKGDAITLAGAPTGCRIEVGEMKDTADQKTLAGAMAEQLGGMGMGAPSTQSAAVTCGNS